MKIKSMKIEFFWGEDIKDAIDFALELNKKYETDIIFDFNRVEMNISAYEKGQDYYLNYYRQEKGK